MIRFKLPKLKTIKSTSVAEFFRYALIVFVFLIPLADHSRMSILYNKILPVRILLVTLFAIGSFFVLKALLNRKLKLVALLKELFKDNILKALGALWLIRLFSIIQSHNLGASLELFGFFTAMIGLYILLKYTILPARFFVVKLTRVYVYVGLIVGFYGLFQYFYFKLTGNLLPGVLVGGDFIRLPATFFDANHFAAYLSTIAPMVVAFAWLAKSFWAKSFWWASYFFIAFVILYSFSRSGLLSLLVSSGLIFALGIRSGYYRKILPLLAAIIMASVVVFISNATGRSLLDRMSSVFDLEEPSTKAHYLLLRGEVELFLENPVFGIGYGGFSEKFRQSKTGQEHAIVDAADVRIPAHSVWFEVITETGILGAAAYLAFVIIVLKGIITLIRKAGNKSVRIYAIGFLSGLVGVWTGGLFYSYNLEFFWFFIFLAYLFSLGMRKLLDEKVILPDGEKKETLNWQEILPAGVVTVLGGTAILYRLGSTSLISSEALLATSTREMYYNPNWLVPTLYGGPYFGYSPLFAWISTHLVHLYAHSPSLIIRVIPALFGIGLVLLTYLIARKLVGRYWGLLSAVTLLYAAPFLYLTRSVNTEIVASFFLAVGIYALFYLKRHPYALTISGASLGLAGLADGVLTVLFLPLFVVILTYFEKTIFKRRLLINVSLGIFLVIFLPWHIFALFKDTHNFTQNFFRVPNLMVFLPFVMIGLYSGASRYYKSLPIRRISKNTRLAIGVGLVFGLLLVINLPQFYNKITPPDLNKDLVALVRSPEYLERAKVGLLLNGVSRRVVGYYTDYPVMEVGNYDIEKAIEKEDQVLLITSKDRGDILLKKFAREERGLRRLKSSGMLDLLANY